jgi:hypothetical protein
MNFHALIADAMRTVIRELPDSRLFPNGGSWGGRIVNQNADHFELLEFDHSVPVAADIIAIGATNRDVAEQPTEVVGNRAFRIKQSSRITPMETILMGRLMETGATVASDRASLLTVAQRHVTRRREGVAITRGILCAAMACDELTYSVQGVQAGTVGFGMPAALKLVPSVYWIAANGTANAGAKPISDLLALDYQASILSAAPYDTVDMSRAAFLAMLASTEYQNQAKAVSAVYNVASLPLAESDAGRQLAERVIGKTINITDEMYTYELADGSRLTGRYLPAKFAVLSRSSEHGQTGAYDFANVPVSETIIGAIAGAEQFGGQVQRGPVDFVTHDRENFSWVRFNAAQEGVPRRFHRAATARVTVVEPA